VLRIYANNQSFFDFIFVKTEPEKSKLAFVVAKFYELLRKIID